MRVVFCFLWIWFIDLLFICGIGIKLYLVNEIMIYIIICSFNCVRSVYFFFMVIIYLMFF